MLLASDPLAPVHSHSLTVLLVQTGAGNYTGVSHNIEAYPAFLMIIGAILDPVIPA